MANLARLRAEWGGTPVAGPGLSTFYFDPADTGAADAVYDFFNAAPLLFPAGLTITVPPSGDILDDATGDLVGAWADPGTGGIVTGTNSGDFFQGVGMRVKWLTTGIFGGRRVVGSTFICPIPSAIADTSGTIDGATVTSVQASADAMIAAGVDFKVWSRPSGILTGESNLIVDTLVPDKTSWLRSRRT